MGKLKKWVYHLEQVKIKEIMPAFPMSFYLFLKFFLFEILYHHSLRQQLLRDFSLSKTISVLWLFPSAQATPAVTGNTSPESLSHYLHRSVIMAMWQAWCYALDRIFPDVLHEIDIFKLLQQVIKILYKWKFRIS